MIRPTKSGCMFVAAVAVAAAALCVCRPAHAQAGIYSPGPVWIGNRLFPFRTAEFLHASTFSGTVPRRSTDPERLLVESIDWARGTFTGGVYLFLDPPGQPFRATTGQIRPVANGYEVSFVATKGSERTSFTGRLDEVITPDRHFWVLEGHYTYRPPIYRCSVGVPCTLGPLPVQLQGIVTW